MSLKTRIPLLQSNPHLINSLGKKVCYVGNHIMLADL